jgi:DNA-binding transcriptional LysR family regulator
VGGRRIEEMGQTWLADPNTDGDEARTLRPLQAAAITYRIAFGPRAGHKVLTLRGAMAHEGMARELLCCDIVENIATALGIAAEGLAATLAPQFVGIVAAPLGLVVRRVKDAELIRKVCIYRSAVRSVPPAAQAFAEFLAPWLQAWERSERKPTTAIRPMHQTAAR